VQGFVVRVLCPLKIICFAVDFSVMQMTDLAGIRRSEPTHYNSFRFTSGSANKAEILEPECGVNNIVQNVLLSAF
jgi:hypothetical protein